MSRPKHGYTVARKIKNATKCVKNLNEKIGSEGFPENLKEPVKKRIAFWEEYIKNRQAEQAKAKEKK